MLYVYLPLDDNGHLTYRALLARAVVFAAGWLLSVIEVHKRISGSGCGPGSAFGSVSGDLQEDELVPHLGDNDDGNDWEFADVLVDSHFDVRASRCPNLNAVSKLCPSTKVVVLEDATVSIFFSRF